MSLTRTRLLIESIKTWTALRDVPTQYTDARRRNTSGPTNTNNVRKAGNLGASELNQLHDQGKHDFRVGDRIANGAYGAVHTTSKPGTIIKFDTGLAEGRLANHIIQNPKDFAHIKSLPKYYSVHKLSVTHSGRPITAIHREDLSDLDNNERNKLHYVFGALGRAQYDASVAHRMEFPIIGDKSGESNAARHRLILHHTKKQLDDLKGSHFVGRSASRKYKRISGDIMHLVHHGISLCDMHASNWGKRANGEIVMRDVGCYNIHKPQKA